MASGPEATMVESQRDTDDKKVAVVNVAILPTLLGRGALLFIAGTFVRGL